MKRTIFVGCGGSGLKTLRLLRRELERQLEAVGIPPKDFPGIWKFLAIDVPSQEQSGLTAYADNDYVGLAPYNTNYLGVNGLQEQLLSASTKDQYEDFCMWRPDPDDCTGIDLSQGAGQYRAVGRAVAARNLAQELSNRLNSMDQTSIGDSALASGRDAADALGTELRLTDAAGQPLKGDIFLVSSLGGGAGSGIFIDAADVIRRWSNGKSWGLPIGILYDPTVFSADSNLSAAGISPNSLMAVSELVAGRWNPWTSFPFDINAAGHGSYRGPESLVMIGQGHGSTNLLTGDKSGPTGRDAVYQYAASMLASLVIDRSRLAERLVESYLGNFTAVCAQHTRMLEVQGQTAGKKGFTSIGYAKISLGRDRYRRYVSDRVTRAIFEKLVYPAADPDLLSGKKTEDQLIDQELRVGPMGLIDLVEEFLNRTGLNERGGDENNQVIDAVCSMDLKEWKELRRDKTKDVVEQLKSPAMLTQQYSQAWLIKVVDENDKRGYSRIGKVREVVEANAKKWVEDIQQIVIDESLDLVVSHGFAVAIKVLEHVQASVGEVFPRDLELEAEVFAGSKYDKVGSSITDRLKNNPPSKRDKMVTQVWKDLFGKATTDRIDIIIERERRTVVAEVLRSMSEHFFEPLIGQLRDARNDARREFQDRTFQNLSTDVAAADLQGSPNEILIDPVNTYAARFRNVFSPELQDRVSEVFVGSFAPDGPNSARHEGSITAASVVATWRPRLAGSNARTLIVDLRLSLSDVRARSDQWSESSRSPDATHINESLRTWLIDNAGSTTEKVQRASRLAVALSDMFTKAAPPVGVNHAWLGTSFNKPEVVDFLSKIPVDSGDGPAFGIIDKEVQKYIPQPQARAGMFDSQYHGDIEVMRAFIPMCASGITSLTNPICEAYGHALRGRGDPKATDNFTKSRRTRRLTESIALPEESIVTITRGWLNARLLDAVRIDRDDLSCTVDVGGETWTILPPIRLYKPDSAWWWLGWALESSMLAIMEAAEGKRNGLDALTALLRLGNQEDESRAEFAYNMAHPMLRDMPTPPGLGTNWSGCQTIAEAMEATSNDLREARIERSISAYQPVSPYIGLRDVIIQAAEQIGSTNYGVPPAIAEPLG